MAHLRANTTVLHVSLPTLGNNPLGANERCGEVEVDSNGDELGVDEGHAHPVVGQDQGQALPHTAQLLGVCDVVVAICGDGGRWPYQAFLYHSNDITK